MQKITEIKLIHNKSDQYYKVTVNGADMYTPFTYNTLDEGRKIEVLAKAAAFDECTKAQMDGKIHVSYLGY